jgi:5-formyltetrahydrofolate cyclo-ligase
MVMDHSQISLQKQQARKQAKQVRKYLHANQRNIAAQHLLQFAPDLIDKFTSSIVAGFLPIFTEIDIIPLMTALAEKHCQLCLPVTPEKPSALRFRAYFPGRELEAGPLNTKHPDASSNQLIPELVLLPLLAFDMRYNRLGYGGGYYDRTLKKFRESGVDVKAVGVAYSGQQVDKVPVTSTDEPMDGVLTPEGLMLP